MFSSPQPQPSSSSSSSLFASSVPASDVSAASQPAKHQPQQDAQRDFSTNHSTSFSFPSESSRASGDTDAPRSEEVGNVPHASAEFGRVPHDAESFRTLPQNSEGFSNVPHDAETFRTVPSASELADGKRTLHAAHVSHSPQPSSFAYARETHLHHSRNENHTLTVREVARRFEAAGVARTERSIVNWCQPNKTGVARLDAYYEPNERRYFITPQSVDAAIQEELAKGAKAGEPSAAAEAVGSIPKNGSNSEAQKKTSRGESSVASEEDEHRVKELEREVIDLKIANRGKDMFIELLQKQSATFNEERQSYVTKLVGFSRRIGELTNKLIQLGGPDPTALPMGESAETGTDHSVKVSPEDFDLPSEA